MIRLAATDDNDPRERELERMAVVADIKYAIDAGDFKEGDHPRKSDGKFGSGGGGGGKSSGKTDGGPVSEAKSSVKGLADHPTDKMRDYTEKELDWEYGTEYGKYSKSFAPTAFSSREDFQKKFDATPLTHMSQEDFDGLENTMGMQSLAQTDKYSKEDKEKYLHKLMGHRRDVGRVIDDLKEGKTAPPIILRKGDRLRLMAGNTRLMSAAALGLNIPVKIMDVGSKKPAQDWFCFDGVTGDSLGPFNTKELAEHVAIGLQWTDKLPPALALDAASVRTYDGDGRLKVSMTPISKACVNPYLGKEIPNSEALGLDDDKIYYLFRDPSELKKAADSFNGVPILLKHEVVSAADPKKDIVVGSTLSHANFDGEYLNNGLTIWDGEAIKLIEDEEQKELSSAYRYTPDMTPGVYKGQKYDGVMRDLKANHVALVKQGRAGPDVVVGDEALPNKETKMAKPAKKVTVKMVPLTSRTALMVQSALMTTIGPRLAADAKPDFSKAIAGVTRKTLIGSDRKFKGAIVKLAKDAINPQMLTPEAAAMGPPQGGGTGPDDAIIRALELVENLVVSSGGSPEEMADELGMATDPSSGAPAALAAPAEAAPTVPKVEPPNPDDPAKKDDDDDEDKKPKGFDEAKFGEIMKSRGMSDDDISEISAAMGGQPAAQDDLLDDEGKPIKPAKDNFMDKKAMDAALAEHGEKVRKEVRSDFIATQTARDFVRPWVGDVSIALDSAEEIYKHTLGALKVDITDVSGVPALRAILGQVPKPGDKKVAKDSSPVAMDAAALKSFEERFPHAAKIRHSAGR